MAHSKRAKQLQLEYLRKQQEKQSVEEVGVGDVKHGVPLRREYTIREQQQHMAWCLKNEIVITFEAIDNYTGRIGIVRKGGKMELSSEIYKNWRAKLKKKDLKWHEVIKRMYSAEYEKHHEN